MRTEAVKIGLLVCVIIVGLIAGYLIFVPAPDETDTPLIAPANLPAADTPAADSSAEAAGSTPSIALGEPAPAAAKAPGAPEAPAIAKAAANRRLALHTDAQPRPAGPPGLLTGLQPKAEPIPTGVRIGSATAARTARPANIALNTPGPAKTRTYIVRAGDNGFWHIASKKEVYSAGRYGYLIRKANPGVDTRRLRPGMKLAIPPLPAAPARIATVVSTARTLALRPDGRTVHIVRENDKYWTLAVKYYGNGAHHDLIRRANPGLDPNNLPIGKEIIIPKRPAAPAAIRTAQRTVTPAAGQTVYTIAAGDRLELIARHQYGDLRLWTAIQKANPGLNPKRMRVGSKIVLPSKVEARRMAGIARSSADAMAGTARTSTPSSSGYVPGRPYFE